MQQDSKVGTQSIVSAQQEYASITKDTITRLKEEYLLDANSMQSFKRAHKPSQTMWHLLLVGGDTFLLVVVISCVFGMASSLPVAVGSSRYLLGMWNVWFSLSSLALVSWIVAAKITRTQELSIGANRFRSVVSVVFALTLMFIFWAALSYPFIQHENATYLQVMLFFLLVSIPAMGCWRMVFSIAMRLPRFLPQAVIVGMNGTGELLVQEMQRAKRVPVHILGFIDEQVQEHEQVPLLGGRNMLRHLALNGKIDMVVMAIDYKANAHLFQDAIDLAQLGIDVVPMTTLYERFNGKIPVKHIGDQWSMALPLEHSIAPLYLVWNKAMDLVFGLCGTIVLLLIFPLLALLIRLDSRGPIFYQQERLGYQGRAFTMRKFRSMYTDSEQGGSAKWATQQDARVTRIGRFMRATHLDELPQVLNILRGEMSLIGPRPEREAFVTELEKTVPFYRCRLSVKPGLTGWAQVKYRYGNSDNDALIKLQYDLYYIKHQSFTLDLFIIAMTVVEVLFGRGI